MNSEAVPFVGSRKSLPSPFAVLRFYLVHRDLAYGL